MMRVAENCITTQPQSYRLSENPEVEVAVEFLPAIQTGEQLQSQLESIDKTRSLRVITWFIGDKRLDKRWFTYLRDDLISPIREIFESRVFSLYNLYNWNILNRREIDKTTSRVETDSFKTLQAIASLGCTDISCLDSAKYFAFLKTCECAATVDYIAKHVWTRDFIWNLSVNEDDSGVSVKEAFGDCRLLTPIGDRDTAKAYSGLQYLEAYFLIEEMIKGCGRDRECEVLFLLPNNEKDYYHDEQESFKKDVQNLLNIRKVKVVNNKLTIRFSPFTWGKNARQRPYLSKGRINPMNVELLKTLKG